MEPVTVVEGTAVGIYRADIDTDQIMPKQHLKRIDRTGFGEFVFDDWRAEPGFPLSDPAYADAQVLVSGPNFGCGSSREHAPWGIQQWGFRAIIAPTFADIFRSNCAQIGLLTVELDAEVCQRIAAAAEADATTAVRIDLAAQTVEALGETWSFDIDAFTRHCLLNGLDAIGLTLEHAEAIEAFEAERPSHKPRTPASAAS